ncbi:MAG: hypothetical protein QM737_10525 [Ferruginibacter sp.]
MFRSIKSVLFSLLLVAALASCEKETSVENGNDTSGGTQSGSAEFTMDGEPLPCTTPLISGDYVVDSVLTNANTVTINVNVTTIGDYTISTGLINGIQFVGTGVFSATGPQTITLFGTGIPAAVITSTYTPGLHGCSFQITPVTAIVMPVGPLFYDATIDGNHFREEASGSFTNAIAVNGTSSDVYLSSGIKPVTIPTPATTQFYIIKGQLHSYSTIPNITFKTFFSIGLVPYNADPLDGVEIRWIDDTDTEYSTAFGTGDQSGSSFSITNVEDQPGQTAYSIRVHASFNCKLYDASGTTTKVLTGGTFVGVYSKL